MMLVRHILTESKIIGAKPARKRARYMLWDEIAPSLGVCVTDAGQRSFIFQHRVNGRMVWLELGNHPALALSEARKRAKRLMGAIASGADLKRALSSKNPVLDDAAKVTTVRQKFSHGRSRAVVVERRSVETGQRTREELSTFESGPVQRVKVSTAKGNKKKKSAKKRRVVNPLGTVSFPRCAATSRLTALSPKTAPRISGAEVRNAGGWYAKFKQETITQRPPPRRLRDGEQFLLSAGLPGNEETDP